MPGTLCQERKGLQPKAVSDRLVSPNGFAVGLSCLEFLLLLWGAEAPGGERTHFSRVGGETEPPGCHEGRWCLSGQSLPLLFNNKKNNNNNKSKETLITSTVLECWVLFRRMQQFNFQSEMRWVQNYSRSFKVFLFILLQ